MPCAYHWGAPAYFRNLAGLIAAFPSYPDKTLQKRLKWIGQCAQIAAFIHHSLDYLPGNVTRHFIEATSLWIPFKYDWGWWPKATPLEKPRCFYLGTYPNRWVYRYSGMPRIEEAPPENSFPIGASAEIPGFTVSDMEKELVNSLDPTYGKKNVDLYLANQRWDEPLREAFFSEPQGVLTDIDKALDEIITSKSKHNLVEYIALKRYMDARKAAFDACKGVTYPPPPEKPQYKTTTPQGVADFPGIPVNQLQLPTPTQAPTPPTPTGKNIFKLQIGLGIKWPSTENAYRLIVTIE